jgi:SAM-dependent methyltransferase
MVMREIIKSFVGGLAAELPEPVYEFGSFQVAGQEGFADLRCFFSGKKYVGCDMRPGKGVDCVLNLHKIDLPDSTAGTVLVLDTLEHVEFCRDAMAEIYRILKPGGVVLIISVMDFPIHDYPYDYWRFTPKGFESLLRDFPRSKVEFVGNDAFPHTVAGIGFRADYPEEKVRVLSNKMALWKSQQTEAEKPNPVIERLKSFVPPILFSVCRRCLVLLSK